MKRIASTGWRIGVSPDGKLFSLGVRSESGRDYEMLLLAADSTPIVTELLREMSEAHRALPPPHFPQGAGPHHPLSTVLEPLAVAVTQDQGRAVLQLDFGGTVLKVAVDAQALAAQLRR